jgi:hypothetical protein
MTYEIHFIQGLFWRRCEIQGNDLVKIARFFAGNEIYPFMIFPWVNGSINYDTLIKCAEIVTGKNIKDNNVIIKPKSFWNRSTESQSEV